MCAPPWRQAAAFCVRFQPVTAEKLTANAILCAQETNLRISQRARRLQVRAAACSSPSVCLGHCSPLTLPARAALLRRLAPRSVLLGQDARKWVPGGKISFQRRKRYCRCVLCMFHLHMPSGVCCAQNRSLCAHPLSQDGWRAIPSSCARTHARVNIVRSTQTCGGVSQVRTLHNLTLHAQ
jgi:hypothetical protein